MTSRLILSSSALGLALAACTGAGGSSKAPAADAPRPVRVAPIVDAAVDRAIVATGTLGARDELTLSFKVGGVVARVLVDAGDRVREGQLLATIDQREVDAGLDKAKAAAAKAQRDLERIRRLYADSVATLEQLQDATTALEVATADLNAVSFNRRYASIIAPAAGTILRRFVSAGELVSPGTPILALASGARGTVVRVGVADRDVVHLKPGDAATVRFDAYPDRVFRGTVREIGAAATEGTGAYPVEVALPDGGVLPSGLVGRVEILAGGAGSAILVPVEALVEADGDSGVVYVLSADGMRAERRPVAIAFVEGTRVAIGGGLDRAASVITEGAPYLNDGDAVRVTP